MSEITKNEGLTRVRAAEIMNLLKLAAETRKFLPGLDYPKEICKYSHRRLRQNLSSLIKRIF